MSKTIKLLAIVPLLIGMVLFTGCEDDDNPSGTSTVTGNLRAFYSTDEIATSSASAKAVTKGGVTLELRLLDGSYSAMATSGADGTFTFKNVPAGDFELLLSGGGASGRLTFTVAEGATVELVDIIVKADGTTRTGAVVKSEPETEPAPAPTPAAPADQQFAVTDGFEGASLDPFWTPSSWGLGTITFGSTEQVHSGLQSLKMYSPSGVSGQRGILVSHEFPTPRYGETSVWVYDGAPNVYVFLHLYSPTGERAMVGMSDWNSSSYQYTTFDTALNTSSPVSRTRAWHRFTINTTRTNQTVSIDGTLVQSVAGDMPIKSIELQMFGPSSTEASYYFDDFSFTE